MRKLNCVLNSVPRAATLMALLFAVSTTAETRGATLDLSGWTVVQYDFPEQAAANWVLSGGNTIVTQTVNADASLYLSDFDATNSVIDGQWRVNTTADDDMMGFAFGYQNRGQYYLFDWKKADQLDASSGFAERGMTVKVVNIPGGADPVALDLWPTAGSSRVTPLFHNTTPWESFKTYDFHLEFTPGQFTIGVRDGANVLLNQTINDSTYTTGKFAFYNYSQQDVQYEGFTAAPVAVASAPEPGSLVLFGVGLLCMGIVVARRRRCSVATS